MAEIQFLMFLVILALTAWILCRPWQRGVEDYYREQMFSARDEIFLMAARGKLSFDDSAYRELRVQINMMIRFAHQMNLPLIIGTFIVMRRGGYEEVVPMRRPSELINSIEDRETREAVLMECKKVRYALAKLLIKRTPILWPIYGIASLIRLCGGPKKLSLRELGNFLMKEAMSMDPIYNPRHSQVAR